MSLCERVTVSRMLPSLPPLWWAHGAGAEAIRGIAAPMIGGLITSTILTLEIVPAVYSLWSGAKSAGSKARNLRARNGRI